MTAEPDPYIALELEPGSSLEQVKEQYRRLAKENHPDLNPDDRAASEDRLRRLNAAYAVLSDPAHKAMLDWRWNQSAADQQTRAAARPASAPPAANPNAKAPRPRPGLKAQSPHRRARPLTREERRRVRTAAVLIGLAMSLSIAGVIYYGWVQPPSFHPIIIAPSMNGGVIGTHAETSEDGWPAPAPIPVSPPPPPPVINAPAAGESASDLRIQSIKQNLQRQMDGVEPKITALALEAQSAVAQDEQMPGSSPERIQWRTQLTRGSRAMLIQRSSVRLEIESLSWGQPQAQQAALERIKIDSQALERQYRDLRETLRQKPS